MPGIKELKTRIKSIGSTRKITRAMQMVSAAKMRKSQNAVIGSRAYAHLAWELVKKLDWKEDTAERRSEKDGNKVGIVLLTTNRGLVGSLNNNLAGKISEMEQNNNSNEVIAEVITYGKKGRVIAARLNKKIVADFPKLERVITTGDIYPIAKYVTDSFATNQYKRIVIVYNHFVSTLNQKPFVKQLLPFSNSNDTNTSRATQEIKQYDDNDSEPSADSNELDTIFEPSPNEVIKHLIPRIIESQIYQAILESDASEHSARMVMMKNATEAAGDLISDYTLSYNQLRQGKITTELAEITAGRIALE